jgi:hypothetical protein
VCLACITGITHTHLVCLTHHLVCDAHVTQTNWNLLNTKVFKKVGLQVPTNVMQGVCEQKPGVIEVVLNNLRLKLQQ